MIITVYGIIIFMIELWIQKKEDCEKIRVVNILGFSYNAILSRHQVTCKPIDCRRIQIRKSPKFPRKQLIGKTNLKVNYIQYFVCKSASKTGADFKDL